MHIGVSLVGNKEIRALNKKYLGHDCATDVLSFNYSPSRDNDFLGDIVVSTEKAREQASSYENTYEQEVADLVAHGVLHLLGVHHEDDDSKGIKG
ncbi:MAG: rRNA maturation RNase YbeY [Patescibacteria group bacterium]